MDFFFNLVSLLANLFSIEDHFTKNKASKTIINNNYNFYINENSNRSSSKFNKNSQNLAVKYMLGWCFFCLVTYFLVFYFSMPSFSISAIQSNFFSGIITSSIRSMLLFLFLLITILIVRIIVYYKKKIGILSFLSKNIIVISLTLNCILLYLTATQKLGEFHQYINSFIPGFLSFPLISGLFYIYKFFLYSSQNFIRMTLIEKFYWVVFTLFYNLPIISLMILPFLKTVYQK